MMSVQCQSFISALCIFYICLLIKNNNEIKKKQPNNSTKNKDIQFKIHILLFEKIPCLSNERWIM